MVAAAVIGGAVVGGVSSSMSASKAAKAQRAATDASVAENARQFDLVRQDTAPVRALGNQAVGTLSRLNSGDLSAFYADPGYQFARDQGIQAVQRQATAQGRSISGAEDKALIRYGTGIANQNYGSFYDRLLQSAGLGNTGIGASASAGANAAANIGAAYANSANARSSVYMQNGANINNAVQGAAGNLLLMKYLGTG